VRISAADPALSETLVSTLQSAGVVIMPCDTIYGLVGLAPDTEERLRGIKGRGERSFLRLIGSPEWLSSFTDVPLPESLRSYWPGPLTLIFPAKDGPVPSDPETVAPGTETVALRVPRDPLLLSLMEELGRPLYSTSVNRSGTSPLWRIEDILEQFEDRVDLILDAGDRPARVPSTILDVSTSPFRLLRSGAVKIPSRLLK